MIILNKILPLKGYGSDIIFFNDIEMTTFHHFRM
jgi:hypothetical protein